MMELFKGLCIGCALLNSIILVFNILLWNSVRKDDREKGDITYAVTCIMVAMEILFEFVFVLGWTLL